jgi:hypothetical protein
MKIEYRNVEEVGIGNMMIEKSAFVGENIDGGWLSSMKLGNHPSCSLVYKMAYQ